MSSSSSSPANTTTRRGFPFLRRKRGVNDSAPPAARVSKPPVAEARRSLSAEFAPDLDLDFLDGISDGEYFLDGASDAQTHPTETEDSTVGPSATSMHQFRLLVERTVTSLRKNGTSKRSKRKNAVRFFVTYKEDLKNKIGQDYTQALFDPNLVASDEIEVHLHAATHIIGEYTAVQCYLTEMSDDLLPSNLAEEGYRTPQDFVFDLIETHIRSHMAIQYNSTNLNNLTPGQAARIVCWIEWLLDWMREGCPRTIVTAKDWQADLDIMWQHYLRKGVRQQLRECFQRSVELNNSNSNDDDEEDIRQLASGEMVTGHPEQIAFIVDSQLAAAEEHLPSAKHVEAVMVACNEEIATMVSEMMLLVGANWRKMGASRFCSVINDASRISEMVEERNEEHLSSTEHQDLGDGVVRDLAELSLHATQLLCERVLYDLQEPEAVLSSVGSPAWAEDAERTAIQRTIATFRDYFSDLQVWLPASYYFPKILKHCFDLTLQTYVESFYSNTLASGIRDAAVVAENLTQDYLNLVIFFNGSVFEKYDGKAGCLSTTEVNARLQIIQSMARLVNPVIPPADLEEDAKRVLTHTKQQQEYIPAAVLHLAGIRQRHDHNQSVEWVRMLTHAERVLKEEEAGTDPQQQQQYCSIKLPDLRNSRHILNVRTRTQDLHRRISVQSLPSAEAMKGLIQTTAPQTKIRNFLANRTTALRYHPSSR